MPSWWLASAEQVVGAQPGLHVLEGDVVDRLAAREGVAEVGQHLAARPGGCRARARSRRATPSAGGRCPWCSRWCRSRAGCRRRCRCAGSPSRSIALAATISAWVESSPPETPMTMRLTPRRVAAAAPGRRPGCCTPRSSPARAAPGRPARRGSARRSARGRHPPSAGRGGRRRAGSRSPPRCGAGCRRRCPWRARSWRSRSRSTSATAIWSPAGKRSLSASVAPFSKIETWPSQARSVVDSPAPAAA